MANVIYNSFKKTIGDETINWLTDTIKVALVTDAYIPDIDLHTLFSDVTDEVIGTGYTAGGATLSAKAITVNDVNDWTEYSADNAVWTLSTLTARGAVVYESVGGNLITYVDFNVDKVSSAGDFTIGWHTDGVFKLA